MTLENIPVGAGGKKSCFPTTFRGTRGKKKMKATDEENWSS